MGERLEERIDRLAGTLERMRLEEYLDHVSDRRKLVLEHILYGAARGFGFMLGFFDTWRGGCGDTFEAGGA